MEDIFGGYLPGEYNLYHYGKRSIDLSNKVDAYRRQLQKFNMLPQDELRLDPSYRTQEFLALQSNPELLAQSRMKLPKLPFGSMEQFL